MIAVVVFIILTIFLALFMRTVLKKDISSPTQITCYVYIIGALFTLIGLQSWNQASISFFGTSILFISLVSFALGEMISLSICKRPTAKGIKNKLITEMKLSKVARGFNLLLCLLALILYCIRLVEMAVLAGYSGGDDLMQFIRIAISNGSVGYFVVLLSCFCSSLSIVYAYYFFQHVHRKGFKYSLKHYFDYIIVIVCTMGIFFISTSRYNFIKYAVIYFMEFIFVSKREKQQELKIGKYLKFGVGAMAALFLIFIITGNSRASFTDSASGVDKFIVYAGSSIPGFCYGIQNSNANVTYLFAGTTFTGVYGIIEYLGGPKYNYIKFLDTFPLRNGLISNVYTCQYNLTHDFGYTGMLLVFVLLGFAFGIGYTKALGNKSDSIRIFYSYYAYYLIMQLWSPQLFQDFLSIQWMLEMFFITCLCFLAKYFVKRSVLPREQQAV